MTIITYCLVAIAQHAIQLKRSTYEVLQILYFTLTNKNHLRYLFDKTNSMMTKNAIVLFLKDYLVKFSTRPFLLDTNEIDLQLNLTH